MKLLVLVIAFLHSSIILSRDCRVPTSNSCSSEYFTANSRYDLNQYLKKPIEKDGKILNLRVNFNLRSRSVSLGTPCDLEVTKRRFIVATRGDLCLSGRNLKVDKSFLFSRKDLSLYSENNVSISKYSRATADNINIVSKKSVKVSSRTWLRAKKDIELKTTELDYFDGEVRIDRSASLVGRKVNIDSASALDVKSFARLNARQLEFNALSCTISKKILTRKSFYSHKRWNKSRKRRKYRPSLPYSGTCTDTFNPAVSISKSLNQETREYAFSINNLPEELNSKFRVDSENKSSEGNFIKTSFPVSGLHLVEAIVKNEQGQYKRLSKRVSVSNKSFNIGQFIPLYFYNQKGKGKLTGRFGKEAISLFEDSNKLGTYYWLSESISSRGNRNLIVYGTGFKGAFELSRLPEISDPEEYIIDELELISARLDRQLLPSNELMFLRDFAEFSVNRAKEEVRSLSSYDKERLALILQSNLMGASELISSRNYKKFNLIDLLIPNAFANEKSVEEQARELGGDSVIAGVLAERGIAFLVVAGVIAKLSPELSSRLTALAFAGVGAWLLYEAFNKIDNILELKFIFQNFNPAELFTSVNASDLNPFPRSVMAETLYQEPVLEKQKEIFFSIERFNQTINEYNKNVEDLDNFLRDFNIPNPVPTLSNLQILEERGVVPSDDQFINAQVLSSEDGQAFLDVVESNGTRFFRVHSNIDQEVQVRFSYSNIFTGQFFEDLVLNVKSTPLLEANYDFDISGIDVLFNASSSLSGLPIKKYIWDIVGIETIEVLNSPTLEYSFEESGTYEVTLTVEDEAGNTDEISQQVTINEATNIQEVRVCNESNLESVFSFSVDTIDTFDLMSIPSRVDGTLQKICECKILQIPLDRSLSYTVTGQVLEDLNRTLTPYEGSYFFDARFYPLPNNRVFLNSFRINVGDTQDDGFRELLIFPQSGGGCSQRVFK